MLKQLLCKLQYILPQHLISVFMGMLANSKTGWIKNNLIDLISRMYAINLSDAEITNPHDYPSFNAFFTRALKPGARTIDQTPDGIASPADGSIAQLGRINGQVMMQAKGMYFDLQSLLGGRDDLANQFTDGSFATIYLAPHNYHRVHMPITGTLRHAVFIPGNLFSVNRMTSELIPTLYARNERLVMVFDTEFGPAAVIMVGALIVGSMQTVWMDQPYRSRQISDITPAQTIKLDKGTDLGRFQMGSTVILLMPGQVEWSNLTNKEIMMGHLLGRLRKA